MMIPNDLKKRIVNYVCKLPNLANEEARRALVYSVGFDSSLEYQITFSGSITQFAELLFHLLINYGEMQNGKHGLILLLEETKNKVGLDRANECSKLINELNDFLVSIKTSEGSEKKIIPTNARQFYLSTLLDNFSYLKISRIYPGIKSSVELRKVYVELPTNLSLSINIKEYKIIDWIVKAKDQESVSTNISLSKSDVTQKFNTTAIEKIITEVQSYIDGEEGRISLDEKQRPLALKPMWQDGIINEYCELSATDAASISKRLVLLGSPGSGKSTFAQHLTLYLLNLQMSGLQDFYIPETLKSWPHGALTPIYIELRRFFDWIGSTELEKTITADDLWKYVTQVLLGPNQDFIPELWKDVMGGNAIFILDGIDEIPIPLEIEIENAQELRQEQIKKLARSLSLKFNNCRIIFTSRPHAFDYIKEHFEKGGYDICSIVSLNDKQVLQLSANFYSAIGLEREAAIAKAINLQKKLATAKDYIQNRPLFLTLMIILSLSQDNNLPSSKGGLLQKSLLLLIDRWTQSKVSNKKQILKADTERIYEKLEQIAYKAQQAQKGNEDKLSDIDVGVIFKIFNKDYRTRTYEIVEYLTNQAGVFDIVGSPEDQIYRFAHRAFQEFLAASYLIREKTLVKVRRHLEENSIIWREPSIYVLDLLADQGERLLLELIEKTLDSTIDQDISASDSRWNSVWLSAMVILQKRDRLPPNYKSDIAISTLKKWLVKLLETQGALSPSDRSSCGTALGFIGDPRLGVGLKEGYPDIAWCKIPAGPFQLGLNDEEISEIKRSPWAGEWSLDREIPCKTIDVDEFLISKYLITIEQFQSFVNAKNGYENEKWWTLSGLEFKKKTSPPLFNPDVDAPNMPQTNVSWYEAHAFCNWLDDKLGGHGLVKLPSELQWEKAARGTDGRFFPWGKEFNNNNCNFAETGINRPTPVGCFPLADNIGKSIPLDMCGNVWEWCTTIFEIENGEKFKYPYEFDERENIMAGEDFLRVVRGGSYTNIPFLLRTTFRGRDRPSFRHTRQGFRIVMGIR